ncbi:type II toxin-antitoxin system tRNA(fMet)-specific endonuclease VapC [Leptospira ilyithenensis]|uniref:Type II toxin-antitoxin system VapC family toxin n=1 Tax=Leptospira ilyithenensis TaxID=2484901 RepID=A0A4R9LTS9_9LEPT|nr:type II toxin-antitoxin system VapC family toxin [Leptospira ilyithenensis]TGN13791.1 type II toxin-antitoxin system VapC family toxin [Leptospira ilyithenensis]
MSQYLLDTNICIYIINKRPEAVLKKFKKISLDNIFISSITEFELRYGVEKSQKHEQNSRILEDFFGYLNIIPFEGSDSNVAANVRSKLEKKGEVIGPYDLLIASQAISKELILVTNNEKEFKRIKEIRLENWIH